MSIKARESVVYVINRFKYIEIDYDEINRLSTSSDNDPQIILSPTTPGGDPQITEGKPKMGRSATMMFDKLLSEVQINKVKDKFKQDVETALEEAIRKHVSIFSTFSL